MAPGDRPAHVEVDGQRVRVTNLDKVMYPATGTTKGQVIAYYQSVAPWLLPHVRGRPVTRKRWPNGVGTATGGPGAFFHKGLDAQSTPEWVATVVLEHDDGPKTYPLVNDAATLVWLAQLAALELHVPQWRFREDGSTRLPPDRLVLDLDPGTGATMEQCVELAHLIREVLDGAGMPCHPVTSGSKGIHLYAGVEAMPTSDAVSDFAHQLARSLEAMRPDLVVSDMKKALREGKVLLDWSQNNGSKTTIAPYSLRGREHPTVAAPRTWDEIVPGLQQLEFTDVLARLEQGGDPLAALLGGAQRPTVAHPPPVQRATRVQEPSAPTGRRSEPIPPMLATPATPEDVDAGEWHYEIKWDGYRAIAAVVAGEMSLTSRGGTDLTPAYPELREIVDAVGNHDAVLDGEVVVLDGRGRSRFELLQQHRHGGDAHYMVFDLLSLDGEPQLDLPWRTRRDRLEGLLTKEHGHVHLPPTLGTDRDLAISTAQDLGLEGVVAKAPESRYEPGRRSASWLKIKNMLTQEVVVVGWSPGNNSRSGTLGSVLLAVYVEGQLSYVGKAGSGFSGEALEQARSILEGIEVPAPVVDDVPTLDARGARWVEPLLVGEVSFAEWTSGGRLRQPVWRGWRPEKKAEEVVREPTHRDAS